eukprot:gene28399-31534_t
MRESGVRGAQAGSAQDSIGVPSQAPKLKDLVIPAFKAPMHFKRSPLVGAPLQKRDVLLYFRGDVGLNREYQYSRRIRQTLYKLSAEQGWREKYQIYIGTKSMYEGDYGSHLMRSKFCLVAPGDGWSARAEDAILHGCIPFVIMDNVHAVFESVLDWSKFSIRINESDIARTPDILSAITDAQVEKMQQQLSKVWHRFAYASGPLHRNQLRTEFLANYKGKASEDWIQSSHPLRPRKAYPVKDDAFRTIIQWLYGRLMSNATGAL